jgi:outer membrane protein assembly factor BamE (lipoprotein component of BamABCDE complex)
MKLVSVLLLGGMAALGACTSHEPPPDAPHDNLTVGKVQREIKVGLSSAAVVEALGSPNIVTTDEKRREVWVYDKISTDSMKASNSSYGTLILIGTRSDRSTGSTRQRTLTVVIKFDEENRVRDFAYNYTEF